MPNSPTAPRVSAPDLPPVLEPREAARRADLLAAALELTGTVDLAYATLEQCAVQADADSIDLTGATLLDVDLPEPRIASLRLRNASIRRLRITGGRIGTLDLGDARVAELELRDVRIDYLNLGAARAEDLDVVGCAVRTIDIPQAELTRVRFQASRSDEVAPGACARRMWTSAASTRSPTSTCRACAAPRSRRCRCSSSPR